MSVFVLTTGGTIDKDYNELVGDLFIDCSHVNELLMQGRFSDYTIESIIFKDSTTLTHSDRTLILEYCVNSNDNNILITHGTDTLVDTAEFLACSFEDKLANKTIVLTGAMIPSSLITSDALFNIGTAVAYAQTLPPNIYIAMNGKCFDWYNVKKDRDRGIFVEIN